MARVPDHLLHHARVRLDQGQRGRQLVLQRNVPPQDALEHVVQSTDHQVQVERLSLHNLFSAEGEQLAGQIGSAFGRSGHFLQRLGRLRIQAGFGQHDAGVALDDGQDVVEIMGKAGGQLAHRIQLVRLPKLHFLLQPVRNVVQGKEQIRLLLMRDRLRRTPGVANLSGLGAEPALHIAH